jgi:hypothetical protein
MEQMQNYLVIGLWGDVERFAETFRARNADHAEEKALKKHPGVTIAAVINEEGQVVQ